MAPTFTIDGYDISSYILWGDRAHDFGQPLSPQFGGNVAFNDGMPWVRTSANNREMFFPLLLDGTTDAIHALVQTINSHLYQGAQVAFKPAGATKTSYFDLEEGFLDPKWDLYEDTAGVLRAGLRLFTRPYAHTGTTRLVASGVASGPFTYPVTGITGDIAAQARIEHRTASRLDIRLGGKGIWAWGVQDAASYAPIRTATSLTVLPSWGAMVGASGAVGSQYIGLPSTVGGYYFWSYLTPPDAYRGKHRLFAVFSHAVSPATAVSLSIADNTPGDVGVSGATVIASNSGATANTWQLADLGEYTVATPPTGESVPTIAIGVRVNVANSASYIASPIIRMAALLMLPLNQSARIVLPSGPFSASGMLLNDFTRTVLYSAPTVFSRNLEGYARGDRPALPPTGSPVASGPLTAVTIAGDMYGFLGNQEHAYSVSARERFSFLR